MPTADDPDALIGASRIPWEFLQATGRTLPGETGVYQIRQWLNGGRIQGTVLAANGRLTMRRGDIPNLATIVPRLLADAERRMRHQPVEQEEEVA